MPARKDRFVIIDGNAIVHRAWHAFQTPLTTKDGRVVTGAYGFLVMLLKAVQDLKPTHLAVAFDLPGGTFRHEAFKEYKAHRVEQPQELYDQIPLVKRLLEAFGIPVYEAAGFEADDVIGTLSKKAPKSSEVIIVTGDLDALQLVDGRTSVYANIRGMSNIAVYDEAAVRARYGLDPAQLIDYKAMRGDASDNLPGLRGIGEKGATALLKEYGSIEKIYKALKKDPEAFKPGIRKALEDGEKDVPLSKELVTIIRDLPVKFSFGDAKLDAPDAQALERIFQELEFRNMMPRVEKAFGGVKAAAPRAKKKDGSGETAPEIRGERAGFVDFAKPDALAFRFAYASPDRIAPDFSAVAVADGERIARADIAGNALPSEVRALLEGASVTKYGHDLKSDLLALSAIGIAPRGTMKDVMLMSYLLNPGSRAHDLASLVFEETGKRPESQPSLFGDDAARLEEEAALIFRLAGRLEKKLKEEKLLPVFEDIEMPLVPVLAAMERHGIRLDTEFLRAMQGRLEKGLARVTKRIHEAVGREFNLHSPAQLQEVLFDELKLPVKGLKKTSTGQISTAAGELEKLRGTHPVVDDIFIHRETSKLLSTYVKALPELIHPKTGRLHTSFNQAVTATGRLSSSDPNLQNIPIRTELGREVRKAFIADSGYVILAADYSQFELRIAASIADDKKMTAAFRAGEDIHTATASEVWNIPREQVTKDHRRKAKAINFGILYGMGPNALAASTGLSPKEAKEFIGRYLSVFSGLAAYMEKSKAEAKKRGWVETMFGRRRYLPEIRSGVPYLAAEAERMAINMPIQGTQADIIKLAMIRLHERISRDYGFGPEAGVKMLLQVHDELVFEVKQELAREASSWIRETMEGAVKLKVPVDVKVEMGQSWGTLEVL